MLGQVVYQRDGKGLRWSGPCPWVPVLRVALDPEGSGPADGRDGGPAAGPAGAARVLVPEDFPFWEELSRAGLRPVDPLPLLRSCAAPMALALLPPKGGPAAGGSGPAGSRAGGIWSGRRRSCAQGAGFVPLRTDGRRGSWNATSTDSTVWPSAGLGRRQAAIRFDPRAEEAGRRSSPCLGRKRIWRGWRCRSPA